MNIPESWGHKADAVVACLSAAVALALFLAGFALVHVSTRVMPYIALFPLVEMAWWAWIAHTLWRRWNDGCYPHAAWHIAIAVPLASLSIVSCLTHAPLSPISAISPLWTDRLYQQVLCSLLWWWQQA